MSRPISLALIALMLIAPPAQAGPWPRPPGEGFLALSHETAGDGGWSAYYGEYGLSRRFTLGIDGGRDTDGGQTAILFLQRAFGDPSGRHRLSASLGLGITETGAGSHPLGQLGLNYGRGFSTGAANGWFAAEAKLRLLPVQGDPVLLGAGTAEEVEFSPVALGSTAKLDLTLGVALPKDALIFGQLQLEKPQEARLSARLSGSVVRGLSKACKVEFLLAQPLTRADGPAVKLGLWFDF